MEFVEKRVIRPLTKLLVDGVADVRRNAALSLARLGSDAGHEELLKMLDREALSSYEQLPDDKIEEIMMNAVRGIGLLARSEALPVLADISNHDRSLKVRQVAIEVLNQKK